MGINIKMPLKGNQTKDLTVGMLCLSGFVNDDSNVTIPYEHYQRSPTPFLFHNIPRSTHIKTKQLNPYSSLLILIFPYKRWSYFSFIRMEYSSRTSNLRSSSPFSSNGFSNSSWMLSKLTRMTLYKIAKIYPAET